MTHQQEIALAYLAGLLDTRIGHITTQMDTKTVSSVEWHTNQPLMAERVVNTLRSLDVSYDRNSHIVSVTDEAGIRKALLLCKPYSHSRKIPDFVHWVN